MVVNPQDISLQYGLKLQSGSNNGPGDRWDNSWMQYQGDRRPMTVEAWNQPRYV